MDLLKRLQALLQLAPACEVIADIGSDHGLLPIAFIKEGKAKKAIATDISEKSLHKAIINIGKSAMEGEIELRTGDGLSVLRPSEASLIVISGLGGQVIAQIITEGLGILDEKTTLLLSPNRAFAALRKTLIENGFNIIEEDLVKENNIFYPLILAKKGKTEGYSFLEYEFGKQTIEKKHPLLKLLVDKRITDAQKMKRTAEKSDHERAKTALAEALKRLEEYRRLKAWL